MRRLAVALALSGLAFLALWQSSSAAIVSPHGGNGSGVPYQSRAVCMRNDTFYTTEVNSARTNWNNAMGSGFVAADTPSCVDGHVTYTGSQQDLDWAAWFATNSCLTTTNIYSNAFNVRAFTIGSGSLNSDSAQDAVCLNVDARYPNKFSGVGQSTRIKGLTHEFGHVLHLADSTSVGTMNTCWCYSIAGDEVTGVAWTYAAAP